ncbi:MAG: glycosyltransferase family 2 protein [Actinomycetota bacterium]
MSPGPLATVVITTHNRPEFVDRAIASALSQSIDDLEVLVVDDASNPRFRLESKDPRIRLLRRESSAGVSAARNAGLLSARGKWITFLDDDDELLPDMLEASLRVAAESLLPPPVAVLSSVEIVDESGRRAKQLIPVSLPKGKHFFLEGAPEGHSFTGGNTLVISSEVLRQIGGFDEELQNSVHRELMLRVNQTCSIQALAQITYRLRLHPGENVHSNIAARAKAMERTVTKHREAFLSHPTSYARYLSAMSVAYVRAGMWLPALRASARAVRAKPSSWKAIRSFLISLAGPLPLHVYKRVTGRALPRRTQ